MDKEPPHLALLRRRDKTTPHPLLRLLASIKCIKYVRPYLHAWFLSAPAGHSPSAVTRSSHVMAPVRCRRPVHTSRYFTTLHFAANLGGGSCASGLWFEVPCAVTYAHGLPPDLVSCPVGFFRGFHGISTATQQVPSLHVRGLPHRL